MNIRKIIFLFIFSLIVINFVNAQECNLLINSCCDITESNLNYNFIITNTNTFSSSTSNCFNINKSNIVLDCQNNELNSDFIMYDLFYLNNIKNITIQNCILNNSKTGFLYAENISDSKFTNITSKNDSSEVFIKINGLTNNLTFNNINVNMFKDNVKAFFIESLNNSIFENVNITQNNQLSYGIYGTNPFTNNILKNININQNQGGFGIKLNAGINNNNHFQNINIIHNTSNGASLSLEFMYNSLFENITINKIGCTQSSKLISLQYSINTIFSKLNITNEATCFDSEIYLFNSDITIQNSKIYNNINITSSSHLTLIETTVDTTRFSNTNSQVNVNNYIINSNILPLTAYSNNTLQGYCKVDSSTNSNLTYFYQFFKNNEINITNKKCSDYGDIDNGDGTCTKILGGANVLADTYVDQANNGINFGSDNQLLVQDYNSQAKRIYLRFNTSSLNNISIVKVSLYLNKILDDTTQNQFIYEDKLNIWDETTINWTNQLSFNNFEYLDQNDGLFFNWNSWDVTLAFINSNILNNKSFMINSSESGSNGPDRYYSKNSVANSPYLNVTYRLNYYPTNNEINLANLSVLEKGSNYTFSCGVYNDITRSIDWANSTSITIKNNIPTFNESNFIYTISHLQNVSIQINISDFDDTNWTYSINDSRFNINSTTGIITKVNTIYSTGEYNITVNVSDGINTSSMWIFIIIPNTNPITTSISITPSISYKNTTIQGYCYSIDSDLDSIKYYYKWYVNDSLNLYYQSTFHPQAIDGNYNITNISKNSNVTFSCMASDGISNSTWVNSSTIIVQNSVPTVSSVSLKQEYGNKLNATCNANDIDKDNLNYYYSFYKNGELSVSLTDITTPEISIIFGEVWNVSCQVFDGESFSSIKMSNNITIKDLAPVIDDLLINTTFKSNIISCDNLDEFYLIDTNWDESNDSTKWNGYTNLSITFGNFFTNNSINITLNTTTNRINLTKEYGLKCTKNNLLTYKLNFSNLNLYKTENKTIDLYYPTCSDLEIRPFNDANSNYNINNVNNLRITNLNPYNSEINKYFYNYSNINISFNSYLNGTNESKFENNKLILDYFNNNFDYILFLSNTTFNKTYAMQNNNTFNFSVDVKSDYNNFSCILPVNFYDTKYPNITIDITSSSLSINSGQSVTLYFNITNFGNNISNFQTIFPNCDISKIFIFGTNESYLYTCTILPTSTTYTSKSTYDNGKILSDNFWVKEGSITLTINSNDNTNTKTSSSGGAGIAQSTVKNVITEEIEDTKKDIVIPVNEEQKILPEIESPKEVIDNNDKLIINIEQSSNKKINDLNSNGVRVKKSYKIINGKTIINYELKNGNILPQYDVAIIIDIPKEIINSTDYILGNFTIIEKDPIIKFYYQKIDSGKEIIVEYQINKTLTNTEIEKIITTINSSFSKKEMQNIENLANKTSQNLDFKIDVKKDSENKSVYTTNIDPKKDLKDVKIYLKIPKCLAEHLSEIEFERKEYEIIEEDPLIAWSFDEINAPMALKFKTLKEVDKDCWEQITLLPIAKEISEKLTKKQSWYFTFWPTLILLITMLLAPYISRHTEILKKEEHKDKPFLHKDILKELEFGVIESILVSLILINLLEFFKLAPPILGFIENTLQWGLILFMIYEISPTEIFFGKKSKIQDRLLILAYFGLVISDIITAIGNIQTEIIEQYAGNSILFPFFNFILLHSEIIMYTGFYLGILIIITLSIIDYKKDVEKDSLLGILHEDGIITNIRKAIERSIIILIIYTTFFLIFFKFFIEWFGMALNSVMVVLGIIIYIIIFVKKHYEHFENDNFIYKVGTFGDEFWHTFLSYFKTREKILYGITGMIVLHLLVDLSNFIIPYLFNVGDSPYFMHLAINGLLQNHTPLIPLLKNTLSNASLILSTKIIIIYLLEFFAVIYFLILPAIVWYDLEKGHELNPYRTLNALFLSATALFFMMPLLKLNPILQNKIVGVDLSLLNIFDMTQNIDLKLGITAAIFLFVFLISLDKRMNKAFMIIGVVFSQIFFLGYTYSYLVSWISFFIASIKSMIIASHYLIAASFMLFFVIIILFYLIGFFSFTYIIIMHWGKQKLKVHDNKENTMIKLIEYIENVKDTKLAEEKLIAAGWQKEIVHQAIINSFKLEEKMKKFIMFEHQRKIQKDDAKRQLLYAGWDEKLIETLLKRYW